jgi:hypothetical protein
MCSNPRRRFHIFQTRMFLALQRPRQQKNMGLPRCCGRRCHRNVQLRRRGKQNFLRNSTFPLWCARIFCRRSSSPNCPCGIPRGYPWGAGYVCLCERPALGWTGALLEAKSFFSEAMLMSAAASAGVAGVGIDSWMPLVVRHSLEKMLQQCQKRCLLE